MTKNIYLYHDEGAGDFSLFCAQSYFKDDIVRLVTAKQIIEDGIPRTIDLFIMPGGADRPYAKKLNGKGNKNIRQYVENGGTYLGICAGAYYGCAHIEFQKGTSDEICEDRELGFLKGSAIGCLPQIATQKYDENLKSATITEIKIDGNPTPTFYWGGCYFNPETNDNIHIIAHYNDIEGHPPAIISCKVEKGKAILSGVHFEVSKEDLENYIFDNKNDNDLKNVFSKTLPSPLFNIKDHL